MTKFVLILAILTAPGKFRQHAILSKPMPQSACMEAAEHPAVRGTYLVDYWDGRKAAGEPALLCVEMETHIGCSTARARPPEQQDRDSRTE